MSNELWSIYLAGPDDLVAMPSKPVAEAVARNFNAVWERYGAERGHDVHAVAHVEPWMHGKEAHAKDIREHFHEYADLVLDEDAMRFKSAQPVEAVDGFDVDALTAMAMREHERAQEHCHQYVSSESDKIDRFAMKSVVEMVMSHAAAAQPRPTAGELGFDRTRETPRRQQAVEKLLALGWTYHHENGWTAPTGEHAGEVVVHRYYDAEVGISSASEWQSGNSGRTDAEMAERGHVIQRAYAQPRPIGVPDGEAVAWRWRSPAEVEFGKGWNLTDDAAFAAMLAEAEGHQVEPLVAAPAPGKGGEA